MGTRPCRRAPRGPDTLSGVARGHRASNPCTPRPDRRRPGRDAHGPSSARRPA